MKTIGLTLPVGDPSAAQAFICPHCGKEYKTAEGLEKHIKDKHQCGEHPEGDQS